MISIPVRCECGKAISVPWQHAGATIRCKQCGRTIRVPGSVTLVRWLRRLPLLTSVLAWSYLAAMCVTCFVMWGWGDSCWPATLLLFIGRWIMLVPIVALAAVAVFARRGALVPLALATIVVVFPIMGYRVGWQRMISHPAGLHVRVASLNADAEEMDWVSITALLKVWQPDMMSFQECTEGLQDSLHALPGWFSHHVRQQCFISRFPILDSAVMDRRTIERIHGDSDVTIGGTADVIRYTVKTPVGLANVTNLHLETPRKGFEGLLRGKFDLVQMRENTQLRRIESNLARRWVNAGKEPTLVMGDFNTPVESQIFQSYWADDGLTDAFSHAGFGLGMTKYNGWIRVRIDHVLTGPGWYADHVAIGPDVKSDHRPLIVDLTLVPANGASATAPR